jgi:hypothetical protein
MRRPPYYTFFRTIGTVREGAWVQVDGMPDSQTRSPGQQRKSWVVELIER